jgi:Putative phage holin Dp-1
MHLDSKVYNVLKAIAQIYLPAAGTLYFALAGIWNLPAPEQVVGTVIAVDTFLGVVLGISTAAYNKSEDSFDGTMDVYVKPDGTKTYQLALNSDPTLLDDQSRVIFKVNPKN